jgi:hypothetical protein
VLPGLAALVEQAMAGDPAARPRDLRDWAMRLRAAAAVAPLTPMRTELDAGPTIGTVSGRIAPAAVVAAAAATTRQKERRRRPAALWLAFGVAAAAALVVGAVVVMGGDEPTDAEPSRSTDATTASSTDTTAEGAGSVATSIDSTALSTTPTTVAQIVGGPTTTKPTTTTAKPDTTGVPGAPTGITLTNAYTTSNQVQVAWQAPASDGGAAITAYSVTLTGSGYNQTKSTGTTTSAMFDSVPYGISVTASIKATNSKGTGAAASKTATSGVAAKPTNVVASAVSRSSISVSFSLTRSIPGTTCSVLLNNTPFAVPCSGGTISGLSFGTTYSVVARATGPSNTQDTSGPSVATLANQAPIAYDHSSGRTLNSSHTAQNPLCWTFETTPSLGLKLYASDPESDSFSVVQVRGTGGWGGVTNYSVRANGIVDICATYSAISFNNPGATTRSFQIYYRLQDAYGAVSAEKVLVVTIHT